MADPSNCYFDVPALFPASGMVRVAWTYPPIEIQHGYIDPLGPRTIYSRSVSVTVN
jgi:hypothetical protein